MGFKGIHRTYRYIQTNNGSIAKVFPLLCPVRETDWLEGWNYKMIHAKSGLIEKDCVLTTSHHGEHETGWQVSQYDTLNYKIEFLRVTPNDNVVKNNIQLERLNEQ